MKKSELKTLVEDIVREEFSDSYLKAAEKVFGLDSLEHAPRFQGSPIWMKPIGPLKAGAQIQWYPILSIRKAVRTAEWEEYEITIKLKGKETPIIIRLGGSPKFEFQVSDGKKLTYDDMAKLANEKTESLKESLLPDETTDAIVKKIMANQAAGKYKSKLHLIYDVFKLTFPESAKHLFGITSKIVGKEPPLNEGAMSNVDILADDYTEKLAEWMESIPTDQGPMGEEEKQFIKKQLIGFAIQIAKLMSAYKK